MGTLHADTVRRLRDGMARGVLSFPLTSFHDDGTLDPDGFRAHVAAQIATGPGASRSTERPARLRSRRWPSPR